MRVETRSIPCGVAAGILLAGLVGGAQDTGIPKSAIWPTGLIRADVVVTDSGGGPVRGLVRGDFEVKVSGDTVPIEFFSSELSPLTLVVLVDVTASLHLCPAGVAGIPSTAGPRIARSLQTMRLPGPIPPAVAEFPLDGIGPGDRVRVGAIAREPVFSARFTTDRREIAREWRKMFALPPHDWLGPSPIHDAVFDAVTLAASEPAPRAVIVVTDGQASGNRHGHREVAELAAREGVSISVVVEGIMSATTPMRPLSHFGIDLARDVKTTADLTGGVIVFDDGVWNQEGLCYARFPARFLSRTIGALRGGYVLGFPAGPAAAGADVTANLEVQVNRPGLVAHVRRSIGR